MDPFSITAGVAGIAAPALQCVRHLRNDIQAIIDAPSDIASLGEDLLTIEQAITSLQKVSDQQWQSLGESVVSQSKTGMTLCKKSCSKFQAAIGRWTRHSDNGKLSWRDRTAIGFFRQDQITSTSSQLQNCKATLTSVVSIATFHSSLQQTNANEEMIKMVSTKEIEIETAISAAQKQLVEVNARLDELQLASVDEADDDDDQASATVQASTEKVALQQSLKLLEELSRTIQAAAEDMRKDHGRVANTITFGDHNKGVQTGVSNAPIHFSIGRDGDN